MCYSGYTLSGDDGLAGATLDSSVDERWSSKPRTQVRILLRRLVCNSVEECNLAKVVDGGSNPLRPTYTGYVMVTNQAPTLHERVRFLHPVLGITALPVFG